MKSINLGAINRKLSSIGMRKINPENYSSVKELRSAIASKKSMLKKAKPTKKKKKKK